jgi:hypothetical protein
VSALEKGEDLKERVSMKSLCLWRIEMPISEILRVNSTI